MAMSPQKWRYFRHMIIAFSIVAGVMIYDQGGFTSLGLVGLGIVLLAFAAASIAIYFFVRDEPDEPDDPFIF